MTDDELGIAWWNALTEAERARWLREAGSARPKDAWDTFKLAASLGVSLEERERESEIARGLNQQNARDLDV